MPPPKPPKKVVAEEAMAATIRRLRENRGWSPAGLASRMTQAGCPMMQSAIWKIENGEPRRRITLDEAVTFAKVFEMSLEDFTVPPELVMAEAAAAAVEHLESFIGQAEELIGAMATYWDELAKALGRAEEYPLIWAAVARAAAGERDDPWDRGTVDQRLARLGVPARSWNGYEGNEFDKWLDEMERRGTAAQEFLERMKGVGDG